MQALAREWPFFRSLLDLLEMVLAKADPDIAAYYDRVLVPDELRPLGQELRGKLPAHHRGGAAAPRANPCCWPTIPTCAAPSSCATPTSTR